jgi:hypothetical protein
VITTEQVKEMLAKVADERGDVVDQRVERNLAPRYVEHGQPCCLVAVVLYRLGFTVAQLRQLDTEAGTTGGGIIFAQSRHPLLKRIAPLARDLLDYVQRDQDCPGQPWSTVADRALQRGRFNPDEQRAMSSFNIPAPHPWNE